MRAQLPDQYRIDIPDHPRFAGFEAFAAREIFPWLASEDASRKGALRRAAIVVGATIAVIFVLQLMGPDEVSDHRFVRSFLYFMLPAGLGGFLAYSVVSRYRSRIKNSLLTKICRQLGLAYTGEKPTLSLGPFDRAGMFPRYDREFVSDGIENAQSGIAFRAAEVRLKRESSDSDTSDRTVWEGLLFAARPHRPFEGLTVVMPERSFIARLFGRRPAKRIELGLGELEAGFEIRSTDPEEARRILTERVMRKVGDLARLLSPERASLALAGEDVLLALRSGEDRFELGSMADPLDDPQRISTILRELALLFELADALDEALKLEPARPGLGPA